MIYRKFEQKETKKRLNSLTERLYQIKAKSNLHLLSREQRMLLVKCYETLDNSKENLENFTKTFPQKVEDKQGWSPVQQHLTTAMIGAFDFKNMQKDR